MLTPKVFGGNLQIFRQITETTQAQLSKETGISIQTISGYENGSKNPSLANAILLANALGESLDRLCTDLDEETGYMVSEHIDNLADIEKPVRLLYEKLSFCKLSVQQDDTTLCFEDCPELAAYFRELLIMKKLLKNGDVTEGIFKSWLNDKMHLLQKLNVNRYPQPF